MPVGASADESLASSAFPEKLQEVDVIGQAEPPDEGMIHVLVEADVFVIGDQTVDATPLDVDNVVDEGPSAGQVVDPLVALLIEDLDVLLAVGEDAHVRRALELEDLLGLHVEFVELVGGDKLELLLVDAALLAVDEVVGEVLEPDPLQTT